MGTVLKALTLLLALGVAGCAATSSTAPSDPGDPYETANRRIFAFDLWLDRTFLARTAATYNAAVPEFGREGIHHLLDHLDLPVTFANDVLQAEPRRGGETLARFTLNSTFGVGGLFDVATTNFHLPNHTEDFGQTLGAWGVGGDPYLVLPVLGPSSPRDAVGKVGDVAADPLTWIAFKQKIWWLGGRQYMKILDARARNIDTIADIERSSVDLYASTRSLYRQHRASEIRNGRLDPADLPEF